MEHRSLICIACPVGCHLEVDIILPGSPEPAATESNHGNTPLAESPEQPTDQAAEPGKQSPDQPEIRVEGNRCPRGTVYAQEEVLAPTRLVTTTCALAPQGRNRVPVRSTQPVPVELIPDLLAYLHGLEISRPVAMGQVLVQDYLGTGITIIASHSAG
jgi:CxxC motif-containing protein